MLLQILSSPQWEQNSANAFYHQKQTLGVVFLPGVEMNNITK